jgi:hypothetical protein
MTSPQRKSLHVVADSGIILIRESGANSSTTAEWP